jgi:CubicO group peptidase (beta-lactamase class C family)
VLERDIQGDLMNLTFTDHEGNTTQTLAEYLVGPKQVQAMLMAHQGKVVFEVYPGMNPLDMHVWMSASKTTAGLLVAMLADAGTVDLDQPLSSYVEELQGQRLGRHHRQEHHEHGDRAQQ